MTFYRVFGLVMIAGCGPTAMVRPAVPLGSGQMEFGIAGLRPTLNEKVRQAGCEREAIDQKRNAVGSGVSSCPDPHSPSAQAWLSSRLLSSTELGIQLYGGGYNYLGASVLMRRWYAAESRFRIGGDLQMGIMHAGLGLPMAWQLFESTSIYAAPAASMIPFQLRGALPLGINVRAWHDWYMSIEYGWIRALTPEGSSLHRPDTYVSLSAAFRR